MNLKALELELQEKGLVSAPRITPDDIEANIASEHYFRAVEATAGSAAQSKYAPDWEVPKTLEALCCLTFCVLVLKNGYTVTGESACVSSANFNADVGRSIARKNAVEKIWPLMGYALKERLANGL